MVTFHYLLEIFHIFLKKGNFCGAGIPHIEGIFVRVPLWKQNVCKIYCFW